MRILLDECVPARLRIAFPGHSVKTVTQAGWRGGKDGPLLAFAENRFDVLVKVDRKLGQQRDLSKFKIGFVIARVPNNRLEGFEPIFDQLLEAAESVSEGRIVQVGRPAVEP